MWCDNILNKSRNQGFVIAVVLALIIAVSLLIISLERVQQTKKNETATNPIKTGKVSSDKEVLQNIQEKVDEGYKSWRLDPVKVARKNGSVFGFKESDNFKLVKQGQDQDSGIPLAYVEAKHGGEKYTIRLHQPVKTGPEGIWVINRARKKLEGIPVDWKACSIMGYIIKYPKNFSADSRYNCQQISGNPENKFRMLISSLPTKENLSLKKWLKAVPFSNYSLDKFEEFQISPEESNWGIDCIKEVKINKNISGYFIHLWTRHENKWGVCSYYFKRGRMITKLEMMEPGLECSSCLENEILNKIISSIRIKESY